MRRKMPKVLALKPIDFCILTVVGLYQLGVRETLLSDRADRTTAAPLLTRGVSDHASEMLRHEPEEGCDDQRHQGEPPLNVKQRAGEIDDAQDAGERAPAPGDGKVLEPRHVPAA